MAVKARDLVEGVEQAYRDKWGYILGKSATLWTQARQDDLEKKYNSNPQKYAEYELGAKFGSRWIGHMVTDCSGLPYHVLKKLGVSIYHGSNSIWKRNLSHKGEITKGMKLPIGAAIFTGTDNDKPHIGTLVSDTIVTEAKTTQSGVVHTPLSNKKWKYWGLYKGVEYDFIPGAESEGSIPESVTFPVTMDVTLPTLRKGAKGEAVETLQKMLLAMGESLPKYGVDGDFGSETLKAVKHFQEEHGLVVDGIVGPKTWLGLMKDA